MYWWIKAVSVFAVVGVLASACGGASEPVAQSDAAEVAPSTGQPTSQPSAEPTEVPTVGVAVEPTEVPTAEAEVEPPVEVVVEPPPSPSPSPVVCEVLVVHGEPHEGVPVDTDGDGLVDDCFYLGGGAGHTHETPTPTAEPSDTGGGSVTPAQPAAPAIPVATATPAEPAPAPSGSRVTGRSGSGAGWYWDGDGVAVVTGLGSAPHRQAEEVAASLGDDPEYLGLVARCMTSRVLNGNTWNSSRLHGDCVSEMSYVNTPLRYQGREKRCVFDAVLQNRVGAFDGGPWYSVTPYDCPTGPDGMDPNPLRPHPVRCNELVDRLKAAGYTGNSRHRCDPANREWMWLGGFNLETGRPNPDFDPTSVVYDPNHPRPCAYQAEAAISLQRVWRDGGAASPGLEGGVTCPGPRWEQES